MPTLPQRSSWTLPLLLTCLGVFLMLGGAHSQECDPVTGSPPAQVILGHGGAQFFPANRNCPDNIVAPQCTGGTILRYRDPADPDQLMRYACVASPKNGEDVPMVVHFHGAQTPTVDVAFSGYLGSPPKTDLLAQMNSTSLAPGKVGYVLLMPQGRCLRAPNSITGDGMHHDIWFKDAVNNLDIRAAKAFMQQVNDRSTLDESGHPIPVPDTLASVDPIRVYVMGHSNGAFFAHLFGFMFPSDFAAVATAAGADPFLAVCPIPYPTEGRKLPVMLVHATCDPLVLCDCTDCPGSTTTVEKWAATLTQLGWGDNILQDVITDTSHIQIVRQCSYGPASLQTLCPTSAHDFPNPQLTKMLNFLGTYTLP